MALISRCVLALAAVGGARHGLCRSRWERPPGRRRARARRRLFAEWQNINEEPLANYAGAPGRKTASESYDWTLNFGFNGSL